MSGTNKTIALGGIISTLSTKDEFEYFLNDNLGLISSRANRKDALDLWVKKRPEEAAAWAMSLSGEKNKDASSQILDSWLQKDSDKAIDWYLQNSAKKMKRKSWIL
ncbi:hypothetical protein LNTAR_16573 [Lentisphaera araneosa HTCC2155]|uniref:Uncharacterized protein n=1 Tax=Lentisphaera araneosa HTCC2155 TaxID=313628 RepID=A6DQC9_9BACT|nr:hypothetical protein [Lentisphaera araneosa]EDM26180.1 hypothetical protein LNTAR_16573 [Lentisphaera araneosa HTCC2155]